MYKYVKFNEELHDVIKLNISEVLHDDESFNNKEVAGHSVRSRSYDARTSLKYECAFNRIGDNYCEVNNIGN